MPEVNIDNVRPIDQMRAAAGFVWTTWYLKTPAGATFEMVTQRPDYWVHQPQIRAGDHIEVQSESGVFWAELFVRAVTGRGAEVAVLSSYKEPDEITEASGMRVVWRGGRDGWTLETISDGETLRTGFRSRSEAAAVLSTLANGKPASKPAKGAN